MAQKIRETVERTEDESSDASLAQRARSAATTGNRLGTAAMLAGGALFARALRSERRTLTSLQALAGAALVGVGLRQRLSGRRRDEPTTSDAGRTHEDDVNPRGTGEEPDVETETEPDEGRIQFTHGQEEAHSHPDLDEEESDPRIGEDEDEVTVDLSEAAMADEASEATGPTAEQAMPSQTDATEPDRSPDEDVSNVQSDDAAVEYERDREDAETDEESDRETTEETDDTGGPDLDIDIDEALGVDEDAGSDADSDDFGEDEGDDGSFGDHSTDDPDDLDDLDEDEATDSHEADRE